MLLLKSTLLAIIFPLLTVTSQQTLKPNGRIPVEVKGVVTNAETGKPISGIYLFVTEGEEEALTDSKGEFKIRTWKPLPFVLTSQNPDYQNVKMRVTQANGVITLKLKKK